MVRFRRSGSKGRRAATWRTILAGIVLVVAACGGSRSTDATPVSGTAPVPVSSSPSLDELAEEYGSCPDEYEPEGGIHFNVSASVAWYELSGVLALDDGVARDSDRWIAYGSKPTSLTPEVSASGPFLHVANYTRYEAATESGYPVIVGVRDDGHAEIAFAEVDGALIGVGVCLEPFVSEAFERAVQQQGGPTVEASDLLRAAIADEAEMEKLLASLEPSHGATVETVE